MAYSLFASQPNCLLWESNPGLPYVWESAGLNIRPCGQTSNMTKITHNLNLVDSISNYLVCCLSFACRLQHSLIINQWNHSSVCFNWHWVMTRHEHWRCHNNYCDECSLLFVVQVNLKMSVDDWKVNKQTLRLLKQAECPKPRTTFSY